MGIKRLLANGFVGLLVMAATHTVVVFAGNCLFFCDPQIEWKKDTYDEMGKPQEIRCTKYDAPHKDRIYTSDSTYDLRTNSQGFDNFKQYLSTSCVESCTNPSYPHKATPTSLSDVIRTGKDPQYTCTMQSS